jgi:hypothetical protein
MGSNIPPITVMARLGLAIHEFLAAGLCGSNQLVDPKAKPWDDGEVARS